MGWGGGAGLYMYLHNLQNNSHEKTIMTANI